MVCISDDDVKKVISILVNTIDQRIALELKPETLALIMPEPAPVKEVDGFINMNESLHFLLNYSTALFFLHLLHQLLPYPLKKQACF